VDDGRLAREYPASLIRAHRDANRLWVNLPAVPHGP
jgi:hypothetical protein